MFDVFYPLVRFCRVAKGAWMSGGVRASCYNTSPGQYYDKNVHLYLVYLYIYCNLHNAALLIPGNDNKEIIEINSGRTVFVITASCPPTLDTLDTAPALHVSWGRDYKLQTFIRSIGHLLALY